MVWRYVHCNKVKFTVNERFRGNNSNWCSSVQLGPKPKSDIAHKARTYPYGPDSKETKKIKNRKEKEEEEENKRYFGSDVSNGEVNVKLTSFFFFFFRVRRVFFLALDLF